MTEAERELLLAVAHCVKHSYGHVAELIDAVESESADEGEGEGEGEGEEKPKRKAKKR